MFVRPFVFRQLLGSFRQKATRNRKLYGIVSKSLEEKILPINAGQDGPLDSSRIVNTGAVVERLPVGVVVCGQS